ncbi:hypothetical protein D3C78_1518770 [compost metagenome]
MNSLHRSLRQVTALNAFLLQMLCSYRIHSQHFAVYCCSLQMPPLNRCFLYIPALYSRIRQQSFLQQLRRQMTRLYHSVP